MSDGNTVTFIALFLIVIAIGSWLERHFRHQHRSQRQ